MNQGVLMWHAFLVKAVTAGYERSKNMLQPPENYVQPPENFVQPPESYVQPPENYVQSFNRKLLKRFSLKRQTGLG